MVSRSPRPSEEPPLLCHRCGVSLQAGADDFFVVRIEAFADPTPATITAEDLKRDARAEFERIIEQVTSRSGQELIDDVHRRMTIHLCGPCYRRWIENPAGSPS